ncbi:MAG: DUF4339 domain-containing protein [Pirellulaceae bacterium]
MGILFHCPVCERPLNVKSELANQPGVCPNCSKRILVPADSELVEAEFRTRLRQWTEKQAERQSQVEPPPPISPDLQSASDSTVTTSSIMLQPPPVDQSGVSSVLTESQKVAVGVESRVADGQSPPDPLEQSVDGVWYVRPPSGGQFGPASSELMKQWIDEGRVTGDSYVWCEGWENWEVAGERFQSLLGSAGNSVSAVDTEKPASTTSRARAAWLKARRRRTMWGMAGLVAGAIAVIVLLIVLFVVVGNQ